MNEYEILLEIFRFIRNFSTATYTLPRVCRETIQYLKDGGYQVEVLDKHRDWQTIQVDQHRYKILRYPDWCRYDVIRSV